VQKLEYACALLQMLYQYDGCVQVMERLMSISSDYWSQFINIDADGTRDVGTPHLSEGIVYSCS